MHRILIYCNSTVDANMVKPNKWHQATDDIQKIAYTVCFVTAVSDADNTQIACLVCMQGAHVWHQRATKMCSITMHICTLALNTSPSCFIFNAHLFYETTATLHVIVYTCTLT